MSDISEISDEQFASIRAYVDFSEVDQRALADLLPLARPFFGAIAEDFYDAIAAHEDARQVFTGGEAQINRLKRTLVSWMGSLLEGPFDQAYLESRARIGRVHVRIGLPQHYMFTAMNRIRSRLMDIVFQGGAALDRARTTGALNRILDIELALMLDTYRADLEAKNRASERLATIGQLAASIGHELRNPLGVIESSLYLVRARLGQSGYADPGVEKHCAKIEQQVKSCAKTISNLLDLARDKKPDASPHSARAIVEQALNLCSVPPGVVVEVDIPEGLTVHADALDLAHVISNLVTNGVQAQGDDARIWISGRENQDGAELLVRDAGPGVPTQLRQRIFDALFTTKARGTGLGLALCLRVVRAHGGEISVIENGPGATFRVWLPALHSAVASVGVEATGGLE